ncbi:DUF1410 domain-containing protein [Mesomycoplasma lagogenitalium]|uniref:DUF1410 domain-containing protein n=1 Tax=Mesomycoplasma lagogenitalium TaxID=171286 RepID=A0ABY8LXB9_9BACT|nr:DUF1410 domain-containing protein [Mesomycoplasma lagogenitalium]WGI36978.1 DUF1410 domain-containing protein [Mesomycoplasma lagogenitalium]
MKKAKNKKGLILGATFGSALGTSLGLIPLLLNKFEKNELIKVEEFQSTNIFENGATIDFKLDYNSMSNVARESLENKPDLNINILEHFSNRIFDTQTVKYNANKKSYSIDLKNLEAGKIYTFQILDLKKVNFTFDIHKNSSFIITKPEVNSINYEFNQKQANLKMTFADEEMALKDQEAEVIIKKVADQSVEHKVKSTIKLTSELDKVAKKQSVISLDATFDNLERNVDYFVDKIIVNNRLIDINKKVNNEFRTPIIQSTLEKMNVLNVKETSLDLDFYFDKKDQDIENKFIDVYFAERVKNLDQSISYKQPLMKKIQIVKAKELLNNQEVDVYKASLNLNQLSPGTSYEIINMYSPDLAIASEIVQISIGRETPDKWAFSTKAVVENISVNTEAEKSAYIVVKLKDDLMTENNKIAYLKYKPDNESETQVAFADIVGNYARFNLLNLKGLVDYSITEIGTEINNEKVPFKYKETFQESQKHFIPTISNVIIDDINYDIEKTSENSTLITVDFAKSQDFLVNRKVRLNYSEAGTNVENIVPDKQNDGVVIQKEGERIFAQFTVNNLSGGTIYNVNEITLDDDPSKNIVENSLQLKFSSLMDGIKRRFITKATLNDIFYKGDDTSVDLSLVFKNGYDNDLSFENKTVTIKYVDVEDPTNELKVASSTIKNNFATFNLRDLVQSKVYEIKSVSVENHLNSNNDSELLTVSPLITEEKRRFFTTANLALVNNISFTPISITQANLTLQFDSQSSFVNNSTLILKYRKLGSSIVSNDVKEAVINDQSTVNYSFDNLEIGTKYIIHSLEIKRNANDNSGKPLPKIDYNPTTIQEINKVFATKNGIKAIEFDNIQEREARVIVALADASNEFTNKQLKLTYKTTNDTGEQTLESSLVDNINNKAIFDLTNLNKVSKYVIEKVEVIENSVASALTFNHSITEANKTFWTTFDTANVLNINQVQKTTSSASLEVTFNDLDQAMFKHNFPLKMKYRLRGQVDPVDLEVEAVIDSTSKKYTFNLNNLQDGSTYYITGFDLKTKDNDTIELIDNKPITVYLTNLTEEQKSFSTLATLASLEIETLEEASATIYARFNDSQREIINQELKIELQEVDQNNNPIGKIYSTSANSNTGLYVFNIKDLPKAKKMKVVSVKTTNDQPIAWENDVEKRKILDQNSFFQTQASSVTVKELVINKQNDNANITLKFDDKDAFVNGQTVVLKYRSLDSTEIKEIRPGVVINNNQATVNINNLLPGNRYEIIDFEIGDYKPVLNQTLTQRIFYTDTVVDNYQIFQTSDTSVKVVVSLTDLPRVKNNYNAKLFYKLANSNNVIESDVATINNGQVVFNLTNLVKSGSYVIENIKIPDDASGNTFNNVITEKTSVTAQSKQFTLVPTTVSVQTITTSSTNNSATVKITLPESDSFLEGQQVVLKWRKQGSNDIQQTTANYVVTNNGPTKEVSATFNLNGLEAGSVYSINEVVSTSINKTVFDNSISDNDKRIVTNPEISAISPFAVTELNYKVNVILKDPLSGSSDPDSFDNKELKLYYYEKTNDQQVFSTSARVNFSTVDFNINQNLVRNKTYVISRITYLNDQNVETDLVWNDSLGTTKEFTVVPKTASLSELEYSNITNNSGTVKLKFSKSENIFLVENNVPMKIEYRSSDHQSNTISDPANAIVEGNWVTYTYNLNNLGHGANIRILKELIDNIIVYNALSATNNKEFNTLPTGRAIRNYKHELEKKWTVEVDLKDLKSTTDQQSLKISYIKENQPNTVFTSTPSTINLNKAIFVLNDLEEFVDYKITSLTLVKNNQDVALEWEDSVDDNQKRFKVIPKKLTVSEISNKVSTTNQVNFSLYFDLENKNYLDSYNQITLNYRLKGQENILTKDATVTYVQNENKLKADFSFTVNQDNFTQGSYEIATVTFKNDNFNSSNVNPNNPYNVRIYLSDTIAIADKYFSTVPDVKSIETTSEDQSAQVVVKISDISQTYLGLETKIVYTVDGSDVEITSDPVNMTIAKNPEDSEAIIYLNNLEKAQTYKIKKVLLNNNQMPFDAQVTQEQKTFSTTYKNATVTSKTLNTTLEAESATVTLGFDAVDKFMAGASTVTPNVSAKQLYLTYSSNTTGALFKSQAATVQNVNNNYQVTFNLTDLKAGDIYSIVSLTESESGIIADNHVKVKFKENLDLTFKTKAALGTVIADTSIEKTASLNIELIDKNNTINANEQGILTYKKVNDATLLTHSFVYNNNNNNNKGFTVDLDNLLKNTEYEIVSVSFNNQTYNFTSENDDETNKRFRTSFQTADVTITSNVDAQATTGQFTLNFGQYDDFLNDGWNVNIKYTTKNTISEIVSYPNAKTISNKQAVFDVSNLKGGESYKITEVIFTKANENNYISAVLLNNDQPAALVNTQAAVSRISTISNEHVITNPYDVQNGNNSRATMEVNFDNTNLNLTDNEQLRVSVITTDQIVSLGYLHATTATANVVVDNNNNSSKIIFNFADLYPGFKYRIQWIRRTSNNSNINFNQDVQSDNNQMEFNAFIEKTYLRETENISYSNISASSATVTVPFNDEFIRHNQRAWIIYSPKDGSGRIFKSEISNVQYNDKNAIFTLNNLEGGMQYEIIGITVLPAFVSVEPSHLQQKNNSFYTKAQVATITNTPVSENHHKVTVSFVDMGNYLNNRRVKIRVVEKNKANPLAHEVTQIKTNDAKVEFNITGLQKNTEYEIQALTDADSNEQIAFSHLFDQGQKYETSKSFRTKISNIDLTYIQQVYDGNQDTGDLGYNYQDDYLISRVKFSANPEINDILVGKTLNLVYQELDYTSVPTGELKTSAVNIKIDEQNKHNFEFILGRYENLKPGTNYRIIAVKDLSEAYERVTFNLTGNNQFSTLRKQPTISTISPLKSEKLTTNELTVDGTNNEYAYINKFRFTFNDPKNSLHWATISNWNVSINWKQKQFDAQGTETIVSQGTIDSRAIRLKQEKPGSNDPNLIVEFATRDIKEYIGKEFSFSFSNITYMEKTDNTVAKQFSVSVDEKGNELNSLLKAQLIVDEISYPRYSGNNWLGIALRVYDPMRVLADTPINNGPFNSANTWDRTNSPYPTHFTFQTIEAFGSDNFKKNSNGTKIGDNSDGAFVGEYWDKRHQKTLSNFYLKQDHSFFQNGRIWRELNPSVDRISVKRETSDQNYVNFSIFFRFDDSAVMNNNNLAGRLLRINPDEFSALIMQIPTHNSNSNISDTSDGITLLADKLRDQNYMYVNPTHPTLDGITGNSNTVSGRGVSLNAIKGVVSSKDGKINVIERPGSLNNHTDRNNDYFRIVKTSFDPNTNQFTVNYGTQQSSVNNGTGSYWHYVYAVFIDQSTGTLYFAGDKNGDGVQIYGNTNTFYLKPSTLNIKDDEEIPVGKTVRFIGLWSQAFDFNNKVFPVLVDERNYDDVMIKITPIKNITP